MQGEVAQTMYKHMSKCKSDKNLKTKWWKILRKTQINGNIFYVHELQELILLKCPYYSKWSTVSMQSDISHRNR
jgi:hypothetical protein